MHTDAIRTDATCTDATCTDATYNLGNVTNLLDVATRNPMPHPLSPPPEVKDLVAKQHPTSTNATCTAHFKCGIISSCNLNYKMSLPLVTALNLCHDLW